MPSRPESLTDAHQTEGFDCGEAVLNRWLTERALANEKAGVSRTYVVTESRAVIGFHALSAGSIAHALAGGALRRNAPDPIPVIVLGRLAVDGAAQARALGRSLLADAIERCLNAARIIGAPALIVHALNERARCAWDLHRSCPSRSRSI